MKYLIFGTGRYGRALGKYILGVKSDKLTGFLDNNDAKNNIVISDIAVPVYNPSKIYSLDYDIVVISNKSRDHVKMIKKQLLKLGVAKDKIKVFIDDRKLLIEAFSNFNVYIDEKADRRIAFLEDFKRIASEKRMEGCVAECGVYRGDFSYFISKFFREEKFFLFDTFSGFDQRDLDEERKFLDEEFAKSVFNKKDSFENTGVEIVKNKLINLDRCIIRQGFFPETTQGIEEEFLFVSLDMDLYQPTLEGLRFFYPRMKEGGVILCHDYYAKELSGIQRAFKDFEKEEKFLMIPVGDAFSMAIVKK